MNRIFGRSNPKPKPTLTAAISQTDERIDSYHVKIKRLEGELSFLKPQLKNPSVKQKAIRILKQKKMYEQQLAQLEQQVFNMEIQNDTQENLKNTVITVDAMVTANKALKTQYKAINLDKIEKMQVIFC
jgi:charged multivesicular body protein 5